MRRWRLLRLPPPMIPAPLQIALGPLPDQEMANPHSQLIISWVKMLAPVSSARTWRDITNFVNFGKIFFKFVTKIIKIQKFCVQIGDFCVRVKDFKFCNFRVKDFKFHQNPNFTKITKFYKNHQILSKIAKFYHFGSHFGCCFLRSSANSSRLGSGCQNLEPTKFVILRIFEPNFVQIWQFWCRWKADDRDLSKFGKTKL